VAVIFRTYRKNIVLFFIAFAGMFYFCQMMNIRTFPGDAQEVWNLAKNYYIEGRSPSYVEYRGAFTFVFYHALHFVCDIVGVDSIFGLQILNSIIFAILTVVLFPYVFSIALRKKIGWLSTVVFAIIVFYFFRSYFLYPLTDFPSFTFLLAAIACIFWPKGGHVKVFICLLSAGILFSFSVMMRFSYVVAFPILLAMCYVTMKSNGITIVRGITLLSVVISVSASLMMINASSEDGNHGLLTRQLHGGMKFQKVEWNAGDSLYPGQMWFKERRGEEILRTEGMLGGGHFSVLEYFKLFLKYPMDMVTINLKHLLGGLDVIYHSVYIFDMHESRVIKSLLNYSLIFIAMVLIFLKWSDWWHDGKMMIFLVFALGIQSLSAIPFIGEVRFFMPLILTFFAMAVFDFSSGLTIVKTNRLYFSWIAFVLMYFVISSMFFESTEKVVLLNIL